MRKAIVATLAAFLLSLAISGVAVGAAARGSNCVAVLTSFFGPQTLVDDAAHLLQAFARSQGLTLGELARTLAGEEGTVTECQALLPV